MGSTNDRASLRSNIKSLDSCSMIQANKFRPKTAKSVKKHNINNFESSMKIENLAKGIVPHYNR